MAKLSQHLRRFGTVDQVTCKASIEGRQGNCRVAHHLYSGAAATEADNRAKHWIAHDTDQ